jgi:hypothetical protein
VEALPSTVGFDEVWVHPASAPSMARAT